MGNREVDDLIFVKKAKKLIGLLLLLLRTNKFATALLGPLYRVNPKRIEIILTFKCDLLCVDCSIMCRQAPSQERMTCEQIEKFVQESIAQDRRWEIVRIIGGEPTLHPNLMEVLDLLAAYKKDFHLILKCSFARMVAMIIVSATTSCNGSQEGFCHGR